MAGSTRMMGLCGALALASALTLVAFTAAAARAQAEPQPVLSIALGSPPPAGFDLQRLQQRVAAYLGSTVAIEWANTGDDAGAAARFVARLDWAAGTMTPLHGEVLDRSFSPARRYPLDVPEAESWEELERLVALKLLSTLRAALAQRQPQAAQPESEPASEPALQPTAASSARVVLELGAGVFSRDGLEAPRAGALLRGALTLQRWAFGVAATLTARSTAERGASADTLESSWAASLRYELLSSQASPWLLQVGTDHGVFVARVTAARAGQERASYVVSPLSSLSLLGGYRLIANGAALLLFGPALDLLWNRSQIRAGGVPVYDCGRVRSRLDLKLMLAF
ncbi:MAG TPA: hypothetical protein VK509_15165 [Polyangiales bacterium]|nr:hypothetical protein [Polyangiales bacterium]